MGQETGGIGQGEGSLSHTEEEVWSHRTQSALKEGWLCGKGSVLGHGIRERLVDKISQWVEEAGCGLQGML